MLEAITGISGLKILRGWDNHKMAKQRILESAIQCLQLDLTQVVDIESWDESIKDRYLLGYEQPKNKQYERSFSGRCGRCSTGHVIHAYGRLYTNPLLPKVINKQRTRSAISLWLEDGLITLVFLDAVEIGVKKVGRVKRAAFSFWVELGTKDRPGLVDHPC